MVIYVNLKHGQSNIIRSKQFAQTVQELYRAAQDELVAQNVPESVIAAELALLRQQSSGLHRRRAKTLPTVPKDFFTT